MDAVPAGARVSLLGASRSWARMRLRRLTFPARRAACQVRRSDTFYTHCIHARSPDCSAQGYEFGLSGARTTGPHPFR